MALPTPNRRAPRRLGPPHAPEPGPAGCHRARAPARGTACSRAHPRRLDRLRQVRDDRRAVGRLDDLQPLVEVPNCPAHLLPEARKEWKRITPELERYGLVSKLDRASLALYCQAWARWVWAERQLQRAQATAEAAMAATVARPTTQSEVTDGAGTRWGVGSVDQDAVTSHWICRGTKAKA